MTAIGLFGMILACIAIVATNAIDNKVLFIIALATASTHAMVFGAGVFLWLWKVMP